MNILKVNNNLNLILNSEENFKTDLGWHENLSELEQESLDKIINIADNYETVRYIHNPYTSNYGIYQTDIWFYFYFTSGGTSYDGGLDYSLVDITPEENSKLLRQSTESFFRLEFFKTPNNESPSRINRRLVFAKNLSLPLGEKVFYDKIKDNIYVPVFMGSNYRNKENMYLFWFQDDTVLEETTLTGNTFWMTAKFYNAKNGDILDFTTTGLTTTQEVNETRDMYYKVVIDNVNYTYDIYRYDGNQGTKIGESDDPVVFFQKGGGTFTGFQPTQPPPPTPPPTPSPIPDYVYIFYIKSETTLPSNNVYVYYNINNTTWQLVDPPNSTAINSSTYVPVGGISVNSGDTIQISVQSSSNNDILFSEGQNNSNFMDYCGFYNPYSGIVISNDDIYLNVATENSDWEYCPFINNVIMNSTIPPISGVCAGVGTVVSVTGNSITFCDSTTFTSPSFTSFSSGTTFLGYSSSTENNFVGVQFNGTSTVSVITGCTSCVPDVTAVVTCTTYSFTIKPDKQDIGSSTITYKCCVGNNDIVSYPIPTGATVNLCVADGLGTLYYQTNEVDVTIVGPCSANTIGYGCGGTFQNDTITLTFQSYSAGTFNFELDEPLYNNNITITNATVSGYTGSCISVSGEADGFGSNIVIASGTTTGSTIGLIPLTSTSTEYVRGPEIDISGYGSLTSGQTININGVSIIIDIPNSCDPYIP
jgi:hypothetical protein